MASTDLIAEVKDKVGILTFNRPEKRNALSPDMERGLIENLEAFARDPNVGAGNLVMTYDPAAVGSR